MPASKVNYLVLYPEDSQVYGSASKDIALTSPPPPNAKLEDKKVYFIAVEPDTGNLVWRRIPDEVVQGAEIKYKEKKEKET